MILHDQLQISLPWPFLLSFQGGSQGVTDFGFLVKWLFYKTRNFQNRLTHKNANFI